MSGLLGMSGCARPSNPEGEIGDAWLSQAGPASSAPVPQLARNDRGRHQAKKVAFDATSSSDEDVILLPMPSEGASATSAVADIPATESAEPSSETFVETAPMMAEEGEEILLDPPGKVGSGLFAKKKAKKSAAKEEKSMLEGMGLANLKKKKQEKRDISANPCFPRELRMTSHPLYVVEPPDVLYIEALQLLPNRPVAGERLVRQDGTISLGYYGQLHVAGLTLAEIEDKLRDRLGEYVQNPQVYVDVAAFNSKVYYVLGQVQQTGRLPVTGNETVLDAITLAGGLTNFAKVKDIHVARPNPGGGCDQILHVDYHAITEFGDTRTNFQLLPGDRVMIPRTQGYGVSVFFDNFLSPIERLASLASLIRFTLSD
ncbi:MAG: polysaccharide biosynthesis/export family protein [Planctomycetota bacterium]